MNVEKEEQIFRKRLLELDKKAYMRNIPMYSNFLNLNEYQMFLSLKREYMCQTDFSGGFSGAERGIVCFYPESNTISKNFPIQCLKISPVQARFAEALTHRDYLGAILNLGIERSKLGDILIRDKEAFLFCHTDIASFLLQECTRIRHTTVKLMIFEYEDTIQESAYEILQGTVSSLRMDSFLSIALRQSRSSCVKLLKDEKVFCNNRLIHSANFTPNAGDIISVRGKGRFSLETDQMPKTKKGRYTIKIRKQI